MEAWEDWQNRDEATEWAEKWWFASSHALREADFNLSAGRYRPQSRAQVKHRDPLELLGELRELEREMIEELDDLAEKVREAVGE